MPGRKNRKRKPSPRNSINSLSLRARSKLKHRSSSHNISNKLKLRSSSHNISSKLKLQNNSNNIRSNKLKLRSNSHNISSKPAGSNNSRTALPNNSSIPMASNSQFTSSKLAIRTLPSARSKPWRLNALSRLFA